MNNIHILFALQENYCGYHCLEKIFGKISGSAALTPVMTAGQSKGEPLNLNSERFSKLSVQEAEGTLSAIASREAWELTWLSTSQTGTLERHFHIIQSLSCFGL